MRLDQSQAGWKCSRAEVGLVSGRGRMQDRRVGSMWRSTRLLIGGIATLISPLSEFARHLSATISLSNFPISLALSAPLSDGNSTDMVLVPQGGSGTQWT